MKTHQHQTSFPLAQECLCMCDVGETVSPRWLSGQQSMSCLAMYKSLYEQQPFTTTITIHFTITFDSCRIQNCSWFAGYQNARLYFVGRTCSLALTVKVRMSSPMAAFWYMEWETEWTAQSRAASFLCSLRTVQCCSSCIRLIPMSVVLDVR